MKLSPIGTISITKQSGLIVIKSTLPDYLRNFFEKFGLTFKKEKHGDGPEHWVCTVDRDTTEPKVLEIYPAEVAF